MSRNLKVRLNKAVVANVIDQKMTDVAGERTRDFDRLIAMHKGEPIEDVKSAIQAMIGSWDETISDPELTQWAEHVQAGTRIIFKPEKVRL